MQQALLPTELLLLTTSFVSFSHSLLVMELCPHTVSLHCFARTVYDQRVLRLQDVCLVQRTLGIGFWGNRDASDMNAELKKQENGKRGSFSIG